MASRAARGSREFRGRSRISNQRKLKVGIETEVGRFIFAHVSGIFGGLPT